MTNVAVINVANRHSDQVSLDGRGKLPTAIENFTAAGVIAPKRVVTFAATPGQVVQSAAPTDAHIGVYLGDVVARLNDEVPIGLNDIVEVEAAAPITQGDTLSADADGREIPGGAGDLDWGVALESASGAGVIFKAKIGGTTSTGGIPESEKGAPGGVATLDGSGKISADELPPLEHDVGQAINQAGMLALSVSAPAICIRTDFSPPHVFFLTSDPATTLGNWVDTGEFGGGAANPTALVGPVAVNGAANSFIRSDGAPAINLTATYPWTGPHSHTQAVTFIAAPKNYEVLAANIASDDRLIMRATSALAARFWFDSNTGSTGLSFAEAGTERAYVGTAIGGNVVLDARATYGLQLMTQSVARAAFDTNGNLTVTVPIFRLAAGGANNAVLNTALLSAERTFQFPNTAGTIALTSDFPSGQYTPTVTPGTNVASATANGDFIYLRVGTSVQFSGSLDVTATAPGAAVIQITLPVAPGAPFADTHKLSGAGAATNGSVASSAYLRSNSGQNSAIIDWIAPNTQANTLRFTAMYTTTP